MHGKYRVAELTAEADDVTRCNKIGKGEVGKEARSGELRGTETSVGSEWNDLGPQHSKLSEIQFGEYRRQTFKWALENAVGWVVGVTVPLESSIRSSQWNCPKLWIS